MRNSINDSIKDSITDSIDDPKAPIEPQVKTRLLALMKQGITFSLNNGKVKLAGDLKALDNETKAFLSAHKSAIVTFIQAQQQQQSTITIDQAPANQGVPLSFAQQRLWFIDTLEQGSAQYNMPSAFRLDGPFELAAFELAIGALLERHEILRCRFASKDGKILQASYPFSNHASNHASNPASAHALIKHIQATPEQAKALAQQDVETPFDLSKDRLFRVTLISLSDNAKVVLFNLHHIICDGWSLNLLNREFCQFYHGFCHISDHTFRQQEGPQNAPLLPPLPLQYRDYAYWQRNWLRGDILANQLNYWQQQLADLPQVHNLPLNTATLQRPPEQRFGGDNITTTIDSAQGQALVQLAQQQNVTLFMLLQSCFALLLGRYSNDCDIVIGTPVSGRIHRDIEGLIGCFLNTLVLRNNLAGNPSFDALLARAKAMILAAFEHQHIPFEMLVEQLKPERSLSYPPLFQVLFTLQQDANEAENTLPGLTITPLQQQTSATKFDLSLVITELADRQLLLNWTYNTDLFNRNSIKAMANSFALLVKQVLNDVHQPIQQMDLLSADEYRQIMALGQGPTLATDDAGLCLHQMFEQQVAKTPDAIALSQLSSSLSSKTEQPPLSYQALNQQANRIAHGLLSQGVKTGALVGVYLPRICTAQQPSLVAALLGILKAGAGYVPLDPDYPKARNHFIIEDAKIERLITTEQLFTSLNYPALSCLWIEKTADQPSQNPDISPLSPSQLAYVIYTSGSTGQPKGVAIAQQNAVALLHWAKHHYSAAEMQRVSAGTSICFDLSIFELFAPLVCGGQVVLLQNALDLIDLKNRDDHNDSGITLLNTVPSVLKALVAHDAIPTSIKTINLAGEPLKRSLVDAIMAQRPGTKVYNLYGPSEDTTYSTASLVSQLSITTPDIGKPIAGTVAYVLNQYLQPVAIGMTGQLYLGGAGVAQGYLNQPSLTAQKFIANPLADLAKGHHAPLLYQTGDLVRWRADGKLDFIGRADNQVKLRGFRIEPGEIEALLNLQPSLKDAAVKVVTIKDISQLVAYVVVNPANADKCVDSQAVIADLKMALKDQLPSHMQPSHYLALDALPLTANGKIDYQNLPQPELQTDPSRQRLPSTQTEKTLATLWQQLLNRRQVGIDDNFFALGGDSIISIQVVARAKQAGLYFSVRQLFEHQTIAALAKVVKTTEINIAPQQPVTGQLPLLPIQQDFFAQQLAEPHHYNQAVLLKTPPGLSQTQLTQLLTALYRRHDALRLAFTLEEAVFKPFEPAMVEHTLVIDQSLDLNHLSTYQASLDFALGHLFKAVYLPNVDGGRLLLAIHHLVVDGVSWRILLSDLKQGWSQLSQGQSVHLADKTHSLLQWSEALQHYGQSAPLQAEKAFWLEQWRQAKIQTPVQAQAQTQAHTQAQTQAQTQLIGHQPVNMQRISLALNPAQTADLLVNCHQAYRTRIPEILLAALALAYGQWLDAVDSAQDSKTLVANQATLLVELEGHGREESLFNDLDITETVGWFTALYPLALTVNPRADLATLIKSVKEKYRSIPNNGIGYGILKYLSQDPDLNQAEHDFYQTNPANILFNYLGQFDIIEQNGEQNSEQDEPEQRDFTSATESFGQLSSDKNGQQQLLACNGLISAGELHFAISFDSNRIPPQIVERFAQLWRQAIIACIDHGKTAAPCFTVADFANAALNHSPADNDFVAQLQQDYPDLEKLYTATPMQQGLLFHGLYQDDNHNQGENYTTQTFMDLHGPLDSTRFDQAWQLIVARYDVLRSCFVGMAQGKIHQLVQRQVKLPLTLLDWRNESDVPHKLAQWRAADKAQGFDFACPPLMRLSLIRLKDDHYHFVWTHHHVLLDGWCLPILFTEMSQYYQALQGELSAPFLPPAVPYENYVRWLNSQHQPQAKSFWQQQLQGYQPLEPLSRVFGQANPNDADQNKSNGSLKVTLPEAFAQQLKGLAQQHQCTLNIVMQAAWSYLLSRYTGQMDVVFGSTVSGRPAELPGVERMIGLFINTIAVRVKLTPTITLAQCLSELHSAQLAREEHGFLPLADIAGAAGLAVEQLFESLLVFENFPQTSTSAQNDTSKSGEQSLQVGTVGSDEQTNFPLTLVCHYRQSLTLTLGYQTEQFSDHSIQQLLARLQTLLSAMVTADSTTAVTDLSLLDDSDKTQLAKLSQARQQYPAQQTLVQLFESQVLTHGAKTALVYQQQSLSYQQLNAKANQLAHYLLAQGLKSGSLVGLKVERSMAMVIGILAILKAGAGYLPLDPDLPQQRLEHIIGDAGVELLVDQQTINLQTGNQPDHNPNVTIDPSALAYVIYTSGSTGQPKGVRIAHHNVVRLLKACEQHFAFSSDDVWPMFHSFGFDFSVWELWGALAHGSTVVMVAKAVTQAPQLMVQLLVEQQVTVLNQTPSAFFGLAAAISEAIDDGLAPSELALRYVVFGGEALNFALLAPWFELPCAQNCQLVNMYGITETTVHATFTAVNQQHCLAETASSIIGKPLADLSIAVCDSQLALLPVGIGGELLIAGDGVAIDYLGQPTLTDSRFIRKRFFDQSLRYYRTGDKVRLLADGQLEYLGRIDQQVKIRGYRIELGEIEAQLAALTTIDNVAVMARTDDNKPAHLVAYVVPNQPLDKTQIIAQLSQVLPLYMVPEQYVVLDRMPLTDNGKINRSALPKPSESDIRKQSYVAPSNVTEQKLVAIWQSVLQRQQVGIDDNFFALGGDSIISIQVVARARQSALHFSVRNLFEHPTIRQLAPLAHSQTQLKVDQQALTGTLPLMPIHHDFFAQQLAEPQHFNQAVLLQNPAAMDGPQLRQILKGLYQRHDSLRLVFAEQATYRPLDEQMLEATLFVVDKPLTAGSPEITAIGEAQQASLSLTHGPLMKVVWFKQANRLLLILHHLIVDGVSWRILLADIEQAWQQLKQHKPLQLAAKNHSQQQWSQALAAHIPRAEMAFWLQQTSRNNHSSPSLADINNPSGELKSCQLSLSQSATSALLGPCHRPYRTRINDLLLAALVEANRHWRGQHQLLIELEGHGREAIFDTIDISETVGWFTSVYPLLLTGADDPQQTIKQVKQQLREIPNNGIGFGVLKYLAKAPELQGNNRETAILFNYLGQFDNSFSDQGDFQPADEYSGRVSSQHNRPSHLLTLNLMVSGGQLGISLNYDSGRVSQEHALALLNGYHQALGEIISHCQQATACFTPTDFSNAIIDAEALEQLQGQYPLMEKLYLATPMQRGLLFHGLMGDSSQSSSQYDTQYNTQYNTQTCLRLQGNVQVKNLQQAWQHIVDRHDILRTCFVGFGQAHIHQLVQSAVQLPFTELTLPPEQSLSLWLEQDKKTHFDFSTAPLMRITLIKLAPQQYQLIWTHHHSLLDGWCLPLLFNEVAIAYDAFSRGQTPQLPQVPSYEHYIGWLKQQDEPAARQFWQQQLAGFTAPIDLNIIAKTREKNAPASGHYQHQMLTLAASTSQQLLSLAKNRQVTLNVVVQTAWTYLLHRYSGKRDIIFGATVSGRPAQLNDIERMVGLFINTVPVRAKFDHSTTVGSLLSQLHQDNLAREENSYISLADIQNCSELGNGTSLFNSLLIFENYPIDEAISPSTDTSEDSETGFIISGVNSEEQTNYGLTLIAHLGGDRLAIELGYQQGCQANQFDQPTIKRLLGHFETILSAIATGGENTRLTALPMLTLAETEQLQRWSGAKPVQPRTTTAPLVHQRFEQQVQLHPQRIAITCQQQSLSYLQLNQQANQLAHQLIEHRAPQGDNLVAVYLERSTDMVVAMMAILKAGCGYLPLDPQYPQARIEHMLLDAGAERVISSSELAAKLNPIQNQILCIDQPIAGALNHNPTLNIAPSQLAYVIYTSGSTGQPKGVCISHSNVCALLDWAHDFYSPAQLAVVAAVTSICFDLSVFEIFVPLTYGSRIALLQHGLDFDGLALEHEITLYNTVPSVMKVLAAQQLLPASVKAVNLAGEALPQFLVDSIYHHACLQLEDLEVYNLYGPSEDTVYSTACKVLPGQIGSPPIGTAVGGSVCLVLDEQLQPLPIGVAGQLYLSGSGLSRGYLNQPQLTAQSFIVDPHNPSQRLYKTGDLVYWSSDGLLHYLGRNDSQVKLRGLRIELSEIEAQINALDGVTDIAVQVLDNQLVAFVVSPQPNAEASFKQSLQAKLPIHMVPERWICIAQLPLTASGKVDRKALAEFSLLAPATQGYVAPQTELQQQLCEIWQQVLKRQPISINDNFFALGGDSIISIQLVSRARQRGLSLTVRDLFEHNTVAKLAEVIVLNGAQSKLIELEPEPLQGVMPLLPIQQDFFAQKMAQSHHYNQSMLLIPATDFTAEQLRLIVTALYQRHDALRVVFASQPRLQPLDQPSFEALLNNAIVVRQVNEITPALMDSLGNEIQASLDHLSGVLFKALLVNSKKQSRLLLVCHHLAVDGISWRILLDDITLAWQQLKQGQGVKLASKTHSIRQWHNALNELAKTEQIQAQRDYWLAQLPSKALPFSLDEPTDSSTKTDTSIAHYSLKLSRQQTQQLLTQCQRPYNSQINELLLAALLKANKAWCGESELTIELEGHGRETAIIADTLTLDNTLGWFTSLYPLKLHCEDHDWQSVICAVKEQYRAIPDKGLGYGLLKYLAQNDQLQQPCQRGLLFNYLGQLDNAFASDNPFVPANEPSGRPSSPLNRQPHAMTINGSVTDGCLGFTVHVDTNRIDSHKAAAFMPCYQQALIACIEHCQTATAWFTPADFANARLSMSELAALQQNYDNIQRLYLATPMQRGMLFHGLMAEQEADAQAHIYTTQTFADLSGSLDIDSFRQAWQAVVNRHDILRSCFVGLDSEQIHQLVQTEVNLPFTVADWTNRPCDPDALRQFRLAEKCQPFDFATAPLMRVSLLRLPEQRFHFVWTYHHVLLDGWSLPLLFKEVMSCYDAFCQQRQPLLPLPPSYESYIAWQIAQDEQKALDFWHQQVAGFENPAPFEPLMLTSDKDTGQGQDKGNYLLLEKSLPAELTSHLVKLARDCHCTVNIVIQGAWSWLIHRYSDETDIMFGATVSGRPSDLVGVEQMVGLFINTIPVRVDLTACNTVAQLFAQLHQGNISREENSFISLADIQRLNVQTQGSGLFDSLLAFENYPLDEQTHSTEQDTASEHGQFSTDFIGADEQTNFGLSLLAYLANFKAGQQLVIKLGYYTKQFEAKVIERLFGHFGEILKAMAEGPTTQPLAELDLLTAQEQNYLLYQQNDNQADYPDHSTIHGVFESQALRYPNKTAIISDSFIDSACAHKNSTISYQRLNQQANLLAHHLREVGLKTGDFVGLHLNRTINAIVAILAVFKAGGAYVPLDPNYPVERLNFIVEDAGLDLIISEREVNCAVDLTNRQIIYVDEVLQSLNPPLHLQNQHLQNPVINDLNNRALAYMIYTSGTTGKPKGVMIEHRGMVNVTFAQFKRLSITADSTMLSMASLNFDASIIEITVALLGGGTLALAGQDTVKSPERLSNFVQHSQASHAALPPALLPLLDFDQFASVKHLMVAGDSTPMALVERWSEGRSFYNGYGPTEATIGYGIGRYEGNGVLHCGRAFCNTSGFIVDSQMRLVPQGVPGELLIGGVGVARGYHNRKALTDEKFIANPFEPALNLKELGRLYRTGDRVKLLEDGNLLYVGRIDNQVKIRGHRIETGEIETRLLRHPMVKDVAVVATTKGSGEAAVKQLVAYFVPSNTGDNTAQLNDFLAQQLPDYMLPAAYITLAALPLTPNGKIDHKALPEVDWQAQLNDDYQAPSNAIEQTLCDIWQQALHLERIGVLDNFFTLGGDSIVAIGVVAKARNCGLMLSVKALFEHKTIAKLAPYISQSQTSKTMVQEAVNGPLSLLPIQQHFFAMGLPEQHHFNQSMMLQAPERLTEQQLVALITALYQRHDVLRLTFDGAADGVKATHQPLTPALVNDTIEIESCTPAAMVKRANDWQSQFDLTTGPLMRAIWFKPVQDENPKDRARLCLILHHLVVDGVSWRILQSDLKLAWQQLSQGIGQDQSIQLANKTSSMQQWSEALIDYAQQSLTSERDYWLNQLSTAAVNPLDDKRLQNSTHPIDETTLGRIKSTELRLDKRATQALLGQCNDAYLTTINELLLAALLTAWQQWCGQNTLRLEMESHGREELFEHLDISETVGWFTALYPQVIRCELADMANRIKQVKEQYRALPNRGLGFGLLKYIVKDPQIIALDSAPSEYGVIFNYLGQFDGQAQQPQDFDNTGEATGYNASPAQGQSHLLAINGLVAEQQLSFSISFDQQQICGSEVETLTRLFEQSLLAVINHCEAKNNDVRLYQQNASLIVSPEQDMSDEGIEI